MSRLYSLIMCAALTSEPFKHWGHLYQLHGSVSFRECLGVLQQLNPNEVITLLLKATVPLISVLDEKLNG